MTKKALTAVATVAVAAYMALLCVYQVAWLRDRSEVKIWEKSRRIGASWVEALYSVLEAAKPASRGGQNTFYLSYNKDMTRQFVKDCTWWARLVGVVCGAVEEVVSDFDKDVTIFRITFANGNVIEGLPSEARSIRSKQGRIVLDEAAFVDDLDELLAAALAMLMWGGQVVILSTHFGENNTFNTLINQVRAGEFDYSLHRTTLDDALDGGLFKAICRRKKDEWTQEGQNAWRENLIKKYGDKADEELFCVPSRGTGVFLTRALVEACMHDDIPVVVWTPPAEDFVDWSLEKTEAYTLAWLEINIRPLLDALPQDCSHYIGEDFGRTGDLSVFWPGTELPNLNLRVPFALELRNCPHRTQKQIFFYVCNRLPRFCGGALDARGNGSEMAEAARQEYGPEHILEVKITEDWYRQIGPLVKSGIEDRATMLPKNDHVLKDLCLPRMVKGIARVPETRTKDETGKRHGESYIALGMLQYARRELGGVEPWECETANVPGQIYNIDWSGY